VHLFHANNKDAAMIDVNQAIAEILAKRKQVSPQHSLLVGISGIDGSGKGYLTDQIVTLLQRQGQKAVGINTDGWLNLPHKRFDSEQPAAHFYEHAIRFDDMFTQLILPLKEKRAHDVVADCAEETASEYHPHQYHFEGIDIIVLEGIYLFKHAYRDYFDLAFWVDCTFKTALERALRRGQEGLPPEETIRAYQTIYFPAQRIHFARDYPRAAADFVINNDPRIVSVGVRGG
jgi:uridine kinase